MEDYMIQDNVVKLGKLLRDHRVNVLNKGLRAMARLLDINPTYLSDIENDRRIPSAEVIRKITIHYKLKESSLLAKAKRMDPDIEKIVTQNETYAAKVPEFLRTVSESNFTMKQWDRLIKQIRENSKTRQETNE